MSTQGLADAGLRGVSPLRRELPARLTKVIEEALMDPATKLESSQACTRLRATYPDHDEKASTLERLMNFVPAQRYWVDEQEALPVRRDGRRMEFRLSPT